MRLIDSKPLSNIQIITFLVLLILFSCKHAVIVPLNESPKFLIRPQPDKTFNLNGMLDSVTFLHLEGQRMNLRNVSRVKTYQKNYYLHDKEIKRLQVFNSKGHALISLDNVDSFDIYNNRLYTYTIKTGELVISDLQGRFPIKTLIGFRGLEFAVLDSSTLVFSTSGQYTEDYGSQRFSLAFVSVKGKFLGFGLPLAKTYRDINFSSPYRFNRKDEVLSFIGTFGNEVYHINNSSINKYLNFDFGRSQMTESRLSKIRQVEDYNFFRFVIDLQYRCSVNKHDFFSYSRNGKEGYVLTDRLTGKIIAEGTGSIIDKHTGFNPVPYAATKDRFIATQIKHIARDNISSKNIKNNTETNVILMFYKIIWPN